MRQQKGISLVESLFALGVLSAASLLGIGAAAQWRERGRIEGAARTVLTQVRLARAMAVREGTHVALVFDTDADGETVFRMHRDGNDNGVRRDEAVAGVDHPLGPIVRLSEGFSGTGFRIPISLPPIEDGPTLAAGSSGVRLSGTGTILSCGPTGTTTSGTLYVAGRRGDVYAVRLLGATGRLRLFEYQRASSVWVER